MQQKIVLMAMGGTISSTGGKGNLSSTLRGEDILGSVSSALQTEALGVGFEIINVSQVSSPNTTPQQIVDLAALVNRTLTRDDVQSVVITHGTSTMEETAYLLDLLVQPSKPVVLTGSMRDAGSPWPDGQANLYDAICVALSPEASDKGVMVVLNGRIHEGRLMRKVNSSNLDAFSSGEKGLLGTVYFDRVNFFRPRFNRTLSFSGELTGSVAILPFYSGADGRYFHAAVQTGESGLVVEGSGLGNVNAPYFDGIRYAREKGLEVIVTTRCHSGPVVPMYSDKGGAASLAAFGVMFSSLPSGKARLLLMLYLSGALSRDEMPQWLDY